jgi:nucleotide-binding universal stress UspA family protein
MPIKTVFVGPIIASSEQERAPPEGLLRFATELAAAHGAHLSVGIGSIKLSAPAAIVVRQARELIAQANDERRRHAQRFATDIAAGAQAAGVVASVELAHDDYVAAAKRLAGLARACDVAVMQADDQTVSLTEGVLEEVLFNSGRPVIVVPQDWSGPARAARIIVAWDGGAKAARALGDAMPLIAAASEVEIVVVSGDPDARKKMEGAEIAPHVARHCANVRVTTLPAPGGDVAAALGAHASMTRADLIVMGAFAHARLRQLVLGGVTSTMTARPPVPVLLSY